MKSLKESLFDRDLEKTPVYGELTREIITDLIEQEYKKYKNKLPKSNNFQVQVESGSRFDDVRFCIQWESNWGKFHADNAFEFTLWLSNDTFYIEGYRWELWYYFGDKSNMQAHNIFIDTGYRGKIHKPSDETIAGLINFIDMIFTTIPKLDKGCMKVLKDNAHEDYFENRANNHMKVGDKLMDLTTKLFPRDEV